MKKSLILTLLLSVSAIASVFSQSKIGYVEYDYVLSLMPQMEDVALKMEEYAKQADQYRQEKEAQLKKMQEFLQNPNILPKVRQRYEQQLQQEYQQYQYDMQAAQYQLDSIKQVELRKVADVLDVAISEVAEDKGFDYILTQSTNAGYNVVYAKNDSDNISKDVMKKLGIIEPKNPNIFNSKGSSNTSGNGTAPIDDNPFNTDGF